jgi:YHS domain-containing protein
MMKILFPLTAALAVSVASIAFVPAAYAGPTYVGAENGDSIAVGGYDAVSYFEGNGTPVKGSSAHVATYKGATYHFSSAANAAKFEANPTAYAPQYGGHCAWAMARGSLAPGDPTKYKLVDGKLYLNFNQQVQTTWLKDISGFITKADAEWPSIPDDAEFGS